MNKQQALEMLPIIQAWAQGKPIQRKVNNAWVDVESAIDAESDPTEYRIKKETKYSPLEYWEVWNEMLKHQPFGWLRLKDCGSEENGEDYVCVKEVIDRRGTVMLGVEYKTYNFGSSTGLEYEEPYYMFDKYEFADGTPFGKMVEGK